MSVENVTTFNVQGVSDKRTGQVTMLNNNIEPLEEDFSITTKEAMSFLTDVLCLSEPEQKLIADREAFLSDLLRAMYHHIPWQTVNNLATPENERHLPTLTEVKKDVISKKGGRCYTFNLFGFMLLDVLGYDVSFVPSTVMNIVDCHTILIVRNLTGPDSEHMVDFGAGSPSFHPIPLDFEDVSPEYTDSFLRYRFVRQGKDVIRQHTIESDPGNAAGFKDFAVDDKWFSFFFIHANRVVNVAHFTDIIRVFYQDSSHPAGFLRTMYCYAYPHGRFVCIRNTTLLLEDEEGCVQKSYLKSSTDIVAAFDRYFPQFSQNMIQAAIEDKNIKLDYNQGQCIEC